MEYNQDLFNRTFLNCAQRQSLVLLKEMKCPVELLFYSAYVPTDCFHSHSVVHDLPRYDFSFNGLTDDDFLKLGVLRVEHVSTNFRAAVPALLERIACDGFVLLSCNLFHIPHRPEFYQKKDIFHFNSLTKYHLVSDSWSVVDDDTSGRLKCFEFSSAYLENIHNSFHTRCYRTFSFVEGYKDSRHEMFRRLFIQNIHNRVENFHILNDVEGGVFSPDYYWKLANFFALLYGSRTCFAEFLHLQSDFEKEYFVAINIARTALKVRDFLVACAASSRAGHKKLLERTREIVAREKELTDMLVKHKA
jgi:hypothetical protein